MELKLGDNLSYYTKPGGAVRPTMPDQDPSFSWSEIKDFVGEPVELLSSETESYAFVQNGEGGLKGLEENELAISLYAAQTGKNEILRGNVFVIHPRHLDHTVRILLSRQTESPSKSQ
jgi:hypothetical protein